MTNLIFNSNQAASMTSLEISQLVESRHDKVKQSIERLAERGVIQLPPLGKVENKQSLSPNNKVEIYTFTGEQGKRDSIIVVAQLSPEFTARLVDRWQELEAAQQQQPIHQSYPAGLFPTERAAAELSEAYLRVAKAFGFTGNQAVISANNAVKNITGISPLQLMEQVHLIAPDQEQLLTVSDIGLRISQKSRQVNKLLIETGLQTVERDHKNRLIYELTTLGQAYGVYLDTAKRRSNGTAVRQIKWRASVVDMLNSNVEEF